MNKISVLILTKNEEENIFDCLESVRQIAEEIIVIDAESSDRTVEIAQKAGARIFLNPFKDFASQRNFALTKASHKWVLYLDADERVTPDLANSIKYTVSSRKENNFAAYKIARKNFYLGNHEWPKIEKLERLFKKDKLKGWYGELHESPTINGQIGELDGYLYHYTHRDLSSMLKKTIEWSKVEAELRFKTGHPRMIWWRFPRMILTEFLKYYLGQGGWKLGVVGLIESLYQSFSIFITYARLWERQNENRNF